MVRRVKRRYCWGEFKEMERVKEKKEMDVHCPWIRFPSRHLHFLTSSLTRRNADTTFSPPQVAVAFLASNYSEILSDLLP